MIPGYPAGPGVRSLVADRIGVLTAPAGDTPLSCTLIQARRPGAPALHRYRNLNRQVCGGLLTSASTGVRILAESAWGR